MIVYLARDIPPFVMYCVNGASCSSLLIESTDSMIHSFDWKSAVEHDGGVYCVIVYLLIARDIPPFVMCCVNGASHSSLLIESTDSISVNGLEQIITFI